MTFSTDFLKNCSSVLSKIDAENIELAVYQLVKIRESGGRLFVIGSGGGAGHASHATCDFRKLCSIEAYAPYDNICELTARINDEGWQTTIVNWLKTSRFNNKDGLFVFSVGGGDTQKNISTNLVDAVTFAKNCNATIIGVLGKEGGDIAKVADVAIIIPSLFPQLVTPITEGLQAIVWHLLVSHPLLQMQPAKWEGLVEEIKTVG